MQLLKMSKVSKQTLTDLVSFSFKNFWNLDFFNNYVGSVIEKDFWTHAPPLLSILYTLVFI